MNQFENKVRAKSAIYTIIFFAIILVGFIFLSFRTPLPLPEEIRIDVILGEDELGMESLIDDALAQAQPEPRVPQEVTDAVTENQEVIEPETDIETQDTEEAPVIKDEKQEQKVEEKEEAVEPERKPNQKYLFNKTNNDKPGKGNDNVPGNKGSKDGNPDAEKYGKGSGNGGFTFVLKGRGLLKKPPKIEADPGRPERVVITITVNSEGKVIEAKINPKGSTKLSGPLVEKAKNAALKTEFTPTNVEIQEGTLTFNFIN